MIANRELSKTKKSKVAKKTIKVLHDIRIISADITKSCSVYLSNCNTNQMNQISCNEGQYETKSSVDEQRDTISKKRQWSSHKKTSTVEDLFGECSSHNKKSKRSASENQHESCEEQISASVKSRLNQFLQSTEYILKCAEENCISQLSDEYPPQEACILNQHIIHDLYVSTTGLKNVGAMHLVPTDKITMLLNVLKFDIRTSYETSPLGKLAKTNDYLFGAADACLVCLHIMTCPKMPKRIFLEDVIDQIISFIKFFVNNISLRVQNCKDNSNRKCSASSQNNALIKIQNYEDLHTKVSQMLSALTNLLRAVVLREDSVQEVALIGISTIFSDGKFKLGADGTRLLKMIFIRYGAYRRTLLEEILRFHARNFVTQINIKIYRVNEREYIQQFTAVILQLLQSSVAFHDMFAKAATATQLKMVDDGKLICDEYDNIATCGSVFLATFLSKCYGRSNDIDYKSMLGNFLQDLVICLNKPEWPVARLMLNLLGKLLLQNVSNSEVGSQQKVMNLDYFGIIAVKFCMDNIRRKSYMIEHIIETIKSSESSKINLLWSEDELANLGSEEKNLYLLQIALLNFLSTYTQDGEDFIHAVYFYIAQWHKKYSNDTVFVPPAPVCTNTKNMRKHKLKKQKSKPHKTRDESILLRKLRQLKETADSDRILVTSTLDYTSATIVANYLAPKESLCSNFEFYLKNILITIDDPCILVRTKALKCLDSLIEIDTSLLKLPEVELAVSRSLLDSSALTREAAVELVGKFLLNNPELLVKFYEPVSARILDTSVGVRKRVVRLLKDICNKYPDFSKLPDALLKIIKRIHDEEGSIQKLVIDTIRDMWFGLSQAVPLQKKVLLIIDVISLAGNANLPYVVLVFSKILEVKSNSSCSRDEISSTTCHQMVKFLTKKFLRSNTSDLPGPWISTLYVFAKVAPCSVVPYTSDLRKFLTLKCHSNENLQAISYIVKILNLTIPHMDHRNYTILRCLEADLIKLFLQHDSSVVSSCVACLAAIINKYSRNFSIIQDCVRRYYNYLMTYQNWLERKCTLPLRDVHNQQYLKRGMFSIGLIFQYFDFADPEVIGNLPLNIKEEVFWVMLYFIENGDNDVQITAINTLGSICIRHSELLQDEKLVNIYHKFLTSVDVLTKAKMEVLYNIERYFQEEENREIVRRESHVDVSLKQMDDTSSSITACIMQIYFKDILSCYINSDVEVRLSAARLVGRVLSQGIVHPIQAVPYLICMCSDPEKLISDNAVKVLTDMKMKYPTFIHTRSYAGLKLSHKLQGLLQKDTLVRGFRQENEEKIPMALNSSLYTLLRNVKHSRRALLSYMLRQFDKQDTSLLYLLYVADNLAYFPYILQEEPLFITHQIDVIVSFIGANVIHTFKKLFGHKNTHGEKLDNEDNVSDCSQYSISHDDEDEITVLRHLPEDTRMLQPCVATMHRCTLLLSLKQYLKKIYGISDLNIQQYSSTELTRVTEKNITRKSCIHFEPAATLKAIEEGPLAEVVDENKRNDLIKQFIRFKKMMLQFEKHASD